MARIAAIVALSVALCSPSALAQGPTIPVQARSQITYTSRTFDPTTGLLHVTGDVVAFGSLVGYVTGADSYDLDPVTGALTGGGIRVAPDGSTYTVAFVGQYISAVESVGTWTIQDGTGRFAGMTGVGTWSSTLWASQLGADVRIQGTTTLG